MLFWLDKWSPLGPLRNLISGPFQEGEEDLTLNLCYQNGPCHFDRISFDLPAFIQAECPPILSFPHQQDYIYSSLTENSKFCFKNALSVLSDNDQSSAANLKWIWKLKIHPKLKFFLWLSILDKLPHCKSLHSRSILQSPSCPFCPTFVEDSEHVLRACSKAKEVWLAFNVSPAFFSAPFNEWLETNLHTGSTSGQLLPWKLLFACLIWSIWLARNEKVFRNTIKPSVRVVKEAFRMAWEYFYLMPSFSSSSEPHSPSSSVWSPPPCNIVKLNTDASFKDANSKAGLLVFSEIGEGFGCWVLDATGLLTLP